MNLGVAMNPYLNERAAEFDAPSYKSITIARLEHLASLHLPFQNKAVIDLGCGIGRLSEFLVKQGANLLSVDGREENIQQLRMFYPAMKAEVLDLETDEWLKFGPFDIVFCYGILYHLANPYQFIRDAASVCKEMLLIETCVTNSLEPIVTIVQERSEVYSQSIHAAGCSPSPTYVTFCLKKANFPFIYTPRDKPNHPEYHYHPDNSYSRFQNNHLIREIFIASKHQLESEALVLLPQ